MLRGLDKRLALKTKLPIHVADDPLRAVVRGTGAALKTWITIVKYWWPDVSWEFKLAVGSWQSAVKDSPAYCHCPLLFSLCRLLLLPTDYAKAPELYSSKSSVLHVCCAWAFVYMVDCSQQCLSKNQRFSTAAMRWRQACWMYRKTLTTICICAWWTKSWPEENATTQTNVGDQNPYLSRQLSLLKSTTTKQPRWWTTRWRCSATSSPLTKAACMASSRAWPWIILGKVVGKVKTTSENFSVLISLINLDEQVSAVISRTGNFGTVRWDGIDPRYTTLQYIPRRKSIAGDSVVTSGLNAVFPENILVGRITRASSSQTNSFGIFRWTRARLHALATRWSEKWKPAQTEIDSVQTLTMGSKNESFPYYIGCFVFLFLIFRCCFLRSWYCSIRHSVFIHRVHFIVANRNQSTHAHASGFWIGLN